MLSKWLHEVECEEFATILIIDEKGTPAEAVKTKYGQRLIHSYLIEAIDKIRAASAQEPDNPPSKSFCF